MDDAASAETACLSGGEAAAELGIARWGILHKDKVTIAAGSWKLGRWADLVAFFVWGF